MKIEVENLQQQIAQNVFALLPKGQVRAVALFEGITCFTVSTVYFEDEQGKRSYPGINQRINLLFPDLRAEMAKLHVNGHAWYSSTFTITPNGSFKFDFDYDHLPAFDPIPSPDKWLDEFKTYPRPELQAQIQDWIDGKIGYGTHSEADDKKYKALLQRLKDLQKK